MPANKNGARPGNDAARAAAGNTDSQNSAFDQPTPEGAAKKTSEVLGEIVWLMSQSPLHKQFYIQDLEWFVMTPILLQQFRLFYGKDRPIGVVLWAHANAEVATNLGNGVTKLRPQDWDCRRRPGGQANSPGSTQPGASAAPSEGAAAPAAGADRETQIWVVEVIAPFGGAEEMVKDFKANVYPERDIRFLTLGPAGQEVKVM